MGRETGPQGGTGFKLLRAQFWTLAQSKYISEGTQKFKLEAALTQTAVKVCHRWKVEPWI